MVFKRELLWSQSTPNTPIENGNDQGTYKDSTCISNRMSECSHNIYINVCEVMFTTSASLRIQALLKSVYSLPVHPSFHWVALQFSLHAYVLHFKFFGTSTSARVFPRFLPCILDSGKIRVPDLLGLYFSLDNRVQFPV